MAPHLVEPLTSGAAPVHMSLLPMRSLPEEHTSPKACNDADACPTLCTRVRGMALAAPRDAQARTDVPTGL